MNSSVILTSMSEHEQSNKVNKELEDSQDNDEYNQPFLQNMNIPSDLNDIQPIANHIWNFDEIGFDTNVRWNVLIFTCELFKGEWMWKVQTGEQSPLWCVLLVFKQYYGQFFMPPIFVHQTKE